MAVCRKICSFAVIVALGISFSGCGESPYGPLQPTEAESGLIGGTLRLVGQILPIFDTVSEETIGPEGGTLEIAGGHSLYFPAGALEDTITIHAVRDPLKILVEFGPEGLVFPDSAKPTLSYSYSETGLLGLLNPGGFTIVYLDGGSIAEVLPSVVDPARKVVRAELSHFSTYALATD
jgi:hypothetical protein